ncbi:MAG: ABC transporter substrate-binding protein [Planctomycetota bacterium]
MGRFTPIWLLAAAWLASACVPADASVAGEKSGATSGGSIVVTDDLGASVELGEPARRVAVVAPFAGELLASIGVRPVAAPLPPGGKASEVYADRAIIVGHMTGPNLEQLAASRPDVVVTTSMYARFTRTIESALGVPVVTLDVTDASDIPRHLETLGSLTGREAPAAARAADVRLLLEQAREDRPQRPLRVLAVFGHHSAMYAFLPDSYVGSLIEMLGGEVVTGGLDSHAVYSELTPFGPEQAIVARPDVLLVLAHGDASGVARTLSERPGWRALPAVRTNRVHALPDGPFVLEPGTDLAGTIALLRGVLAGDDAG